MTCRLHFSGEFHHVSGYFAHSLPGRPIDEWEPLEKHLQAVADLAAEFAGKFGAADWGRVKITYRLREVIPLRSTPDRSEDSA
jgi:hypothetical protein